MTSIQEDIMYEIHTKVHSCKNLKIKFYKQLDKMEKQEKHRFKNVCERWEYALRQIKENNGHNS